MNYGNVIKFWFEELDSKQWWQKNEQTDALIERRYSVLHRQAIHCELFDWRVSVEGRLAEILVLDQFSRNIYRDQAAAFAADNLALALAQEAVSLGVDKKLEPKKRAFLYMPYMHSESAYIHEQAIKLFDQDGLRDNLEFEYKHKEIIDRFARYPHRNLILGRECSPDEVEFLSKPGSSF